jgi:hypothetical protein
VQYAIAAATASTKTVTPIPIPVFAPEDRSAGLEVWLDIVKGENVFMEVEEMPVVAAEVVVAVAKSVD